MKHDEPFAGAPPVIAGPAGLRLSLYLKTFPPRCGIDRRKSPPAVIYETSGRTRGSITQTSTRGSITTSVE